MSLRRLKHAILRLSPEEKVIGIGGLLVLFSMFMPWYTILLNFDQSNMTHSGFSGDLGVIGFVVFLIVILGLLFLVGDYLHFRIPHFGYKKEQIVFFLTTQSAFLMLLLVAVYTKRSLEFTTAELRFGLYLALIGASLAAFSAFAQIQKLTKEETESFFDHADDHNLDPELEPRSKKKKEEKIVEESEIIVEPDTMFFEQDEVQIEEPIEEPVIEPVEEPLEDPVEELIEEEDEDEPTEPNDVRDADLQTQEEGEELIEEQAEEEIVEDEMIEEIEEVPVKEETPIPNQADYFVRESKTTGEEPVEDSIDESAEEPIEEEKGHDEDKKNNEHTSMSFYDDE